MNGTDPIRIDPIDTLFLHYYTFSPGTFCEVLVKSGLNTNLVFDLVFRYFPEIGWFK
jgi:hypothetical protein